MAAKDYYDSLGVERSASADDIQRAYRKLARKYHPDVNQADGAEDRFKEVSAAYDVLKDPEKRKAYDRFGAGYASGGAPPPGYENIHFDFGGAGGGAGGAGGFGSLFENLFRGQGGQGGGGAAQGFDPFAGGGYDRGPVRGSDQEARIALTLEEAAAGGTRELTLSDPMTGRNKTHKVKLPAGVRAGQKIRLAGHGGDSAGGGPAGDLYLVVEIRPHERFRLEDRDLHTTVRVAPWEAALGGKVKVPTLDGNVTIKVPAGASSGRKIRLRGKGFPAKKGGHGDLFVHIEIAVPDTLSDEEKALYEELARVSPFKPR